MEGGTSKVTSSSPGRWCGLGAQQGPLPAPHSVDGGRTPRVSGSVRSESSSAPAPEPRASLLPFGLGQRRPREDDAGVTTRQQGSRGHLVGQASSAAFKGAVGQRRRRPRANWAPGSG